MSLLVGGAKETIEEVRPILECFAERIAVVGGIGAGHKMKLLQETHSAREIADAIAATYLGAVEAGAGQNMVPELVSFLAESGETNDR